MTAKVLKGLITSNGCSRISFDSGRLDGTGVQSAANPSINGPSCILFATIRKMQSTLCWYFIQVYGIYSFLYIRIDIVQQFLRQLEPSHDGHMDDRRCPITRYTSTVAFWSVISKISCHRLLKLRLHLYFSRVSQFYAIFKARS